MTKKILKSRKAVNRFRHATLTYAAVLVLAAAMLTIPSFGAPPLNVGRSSIETRQELQTTTGKHVVGGFELATLLLGPVLQWNTFMGGTGTDRTTDYGTAIATDSSGNVYVVGTSSATWSNPLRSYSLKEDAFVAKVNPSGGLEWNTFLGGLGSDVGRGIAIDVNGNVYVIGTSYNGFDTASWGAPVRPFTGDYDVFAAGLDPAGNLQWNTFLGGSDNDQGYGIAADASGNVYVVGESVATWGTPVTGSSGGFAAKLNSSGSLQWNTFFGGTGFAIAVDRFGNIYLGGYARATSNDVLTMKLNSTGVLQWKSLVGGVGSDVAYAIAVDDTSNAYVVGYSDWTWGSPVHSYTGGNDAFAAKLDSTGVLVWNTFLGGAGADFAQGIVVDSAGGVYVSGSSNTSWGTPQHSYVGDYDGFAAQLNSGGELQWNTFLGGSGDDRVTGVGIDGNGNVFVAGYSSASWGTPTRVFNGNYDVYVARLSTTTPTPTPTPTPTATPTPSPTPTPTASPIQLILDQSAPAPDQVAALDSVLFLRDPFAVVNAANLFTQGPDRNTRLIVFALNLQLAQGETPSAVVVNIIDSNNQSYDVPAEDVRAVPNFPFTQVIFRLPDNLRVGTCTIKLKAHGQVSNAGTIRIRS